MKGMGLNIQTVPAANRDGKVLIITQGGRIVEVISDVQLDVEVADVDEEGFCSFPSRPLWEYLKKVTVQALNGE